MGLKSVREGLDDGSLVDLCVILVDSDIPRHATKEKRGGVTPTFDDSFQGRRLLVLVLHIVCDVFTPMDSKHPAGVFYRYDNGVLVNQLPAWQPSLVDITEVL